MKTPIMEPEDIADSLRAEVRALSAKLENERALHHISKMAHASSIKLLSAVLNAGRPHQIDRCPQCLAWEAVRKELRGE